METIYNVDYFIKKFESIPENKWCIKSLQNSDGSRCALGHCHPAGKVDPNFVTEETMALICDIGIQLIKMGYSGIVDINNGDCPHYQQPTPKQRILAALYDIKAQQQPTEQPKEKVVYKTVVIDSAVKELQETLTQN